jgi:tetratricopeptide (TPR) repeat protein
LLTKQKEGASILVDYEEVAKRLDLWDRMSREAYRRQITKVLKQLDKKYHLLRFRPRHGKEAEVLLIDPERGNVSNERRLIKPRVAARSAGTVRSARRGVGAWPSRPDGLHRGEPLESPKEDYFEIPRDFFDSDWLPQLSLRAQYSLLILYDQWSYPRSQPTIEVGLEALEKRYHVSRKTLGLGFHELAREGLLEIYYGKTIDFEKKELETASYVLLPFYNRKAREEELRKLEALYGKEDFKKAEEYAKAFFKEKDPQMVQTLLGLMLSYSEAWVDLAMGEVILKKSVGNPARSLPYLIGILKDWREKGGPTL